MSAGQTSKSSERCSTACMWNLTISSLFFKVCTGYQWHIVFNIKQQPSASTPSLANPLSIFLILYNHTLQPENDVLHLTLVPSSSLVWKQNYSATDHSLIPAHSSETICLGQSVTPILLHHSNLLLKPTCSKTVSNLPVFSTAVFCLCGPWTVCVCVCVCVWERERERERFV